jgi:hypothetical protein
MLVSNILRSGMLKGTLAMADTRQELIGANFDTTTLPFVTTGSDRFVYSNCFVPLWAQPPTEYYDKLRIPKPAAAAKGKAAAKPAAAAIPSITILNNPLEDLQSQLNQAFGALFLDRVRIRPAGSALGEELLSLSLAPGEEVVIEQTTFSKKDYTFEQQNESESQVDLQFESALTTSMEEGFDQQRNHTARTDLGLKADVTIPVDGVPINVGASAQNSVTDADTASQKFATKQSQTSSQKVSSKYRTSHKTTLRVSTETTFQTSNKRTLRNPNRYTPLDLRYFKIYQKVVLCHERYGVRLAWGPCLPYPGAPALARAQSAYQKVLDDAVASITLPSKPQPPVALTSSEVVDTDAQTVGATWPFGGRMTITLKATPPATPPGGAPFVWDGNVAFIGNSLSIAPAGTGGPVNAYIDGLPWSSPDGTLNIPVHLGWPGGGQVTASTAATFVPSSNFVSQAMAAYQQALADYNAQVASLTAQAIAAAEKDAQSAKDAVLAAVDPLQECFRQLFTQYVPAEERQRCWQFDQWRTIFDWNRAGVTLYPAWWADIVPDGTYPLTHFVNAVAARVYLPIKPSMEHMACELLAPIVSLWPDVPTMEAAASQLLQEYSDYRQTNFGDPIETPIDGGGDGCPSVTDPFICIATWSELLPTEGTHLEVVQASTAADDDLNEQQLLDAASLRQAQVTGVESTSTLNASLSDGVKAGTAQVTVKVVEAGPATDNSAGAQMA